MMEKRKLIIDTYDTAANGWTLTAGWSLGAAEQKTKYVDKAGGDGSWDLSTALTDGVIKYKDRPFSATLECSKGDRMSREAKIDHMINLLDGKRVDIVLPDDPTRHINGRVHIVKDYNDLAHGAVTVTAVCMPYRFANEETVVTLTAKTDKQTIELVNEGRQAVVPVLTVAGGQVLLAFGSASLALSEGVHKWPDLLLTTGTHVLTYSGTGSVTITYREAVL